MADTAPHDLKKKDILKIEQLFQNNSAAKRYLPGITSKAAYREAVTKIYDETGDFIPISYWDALQSYNEEFFPAEKPPQTAESSIETEKKHKDDKHNVSHSGGHPSEPKQNKIEDKVVDERETHRSDLQEQAMAENTSAATASPETTTPPPPFIEASAENQYTSLDANPFYPENDLKEESAPQSEGTWPELEIGTEVPPTSPSYDPKEVLAQSTERFNEMMESKKTYDEATERANELYDRVRDDSEEQSNSRDSLQNRATSEIRNSASSEIRSRLKNRFLNSSLKENASKGVKNISEKGASYLRSGVKNGTNSISKFLGRFGAGGTAAGGVATAGAGITAVGEGAVVTAPVWGPFAIAIILLILFIILLIILVMNPSSKPPSQQVTIFKTGPPQVANPSKGLQGSLITYKIAVTMPAGTREVVVTDTLDDNAGHYTSTGPNAKFFDNTGAPLDLSKPGSDDKVKTIKWTVQGTQAANPLPAGGTGTIENLGFGPSDGTRINNLIKALGYENSPMMGQGDLIVSLANEFGVDPLMIILTINESGMCTDTGVVSPGGSDPDNYNCGGITWEAAQITDLARWSAKAGPQANGHVFTFVPSVQNGMGLLFNYIGKYPAYKGKTLPEFYDIYNPCTDPGNQGQFACGAAEAQKMINLLQTNAGPASDGSNTQYQPGVYTTSWDLTVKPKSDDSYVINQAYVNAVGAGVVGIDAKTLDDIFRASAANAGVPYAFLKAIARVETGGAVFNYTDQDVTNFSIRDWWVGRVDNAPTIAGNDPLIVKGFAYNTCAYRTDCFSGADVRGVMQFEIQSWNGIIGSIPTADGHTPDRRYIKDNIIGSGILIRNKIKAKYPNIGTDNWTDQQVRDAASAYCGDPTSSACMGAGVPYDVAVLQYYKEYLAGQ